MKTTHESMTPERHRTTSKTRSVRSKDKTLAITFFDKQAVIYDRWMPLNMKCQ